MSSIFENKDFRLKLAENEKQFTIMYLEKAKQMIDRNQIILAINDLENALTHAKVAKRHLEKTDIKQDSKETQENKQLEKMEFV